MCGWFKILLIFSVHNIALADDFILFRDIVASNTPLVKINADGSGRQEVVSDVEFFTVSPDQKFLVVFKNSCEKKNVCAITIYDLAQGRKKILKLPHAEWSGSWWSEDSITLNFFRSVRVGDSGPSCGEGDEQEGCAARARLEAGVLSVLTGIFEIKKDFGIGQYSKLSEYEDKNRIVISEAVSKDGTKLLRWKRNIDLFVKVLLVNIASGVEKTVFAWERGDFTEGMTVNRHAWSPDSDYFVVNNIRGGPFSKWTICTINAHSLERKKIVTGYNPHWIINGVLQE
jgi:hypothetical protein